MKAPDLVTVTAFKKAHSPRCALGLLPDGVNFLDFGF
jgi:hypothetical protein